MPPLKRWLGTINGLLRLLFNPVVTLTSAGSISAEHGVGQLRRDEVRHYKSSVEMDLMLSIKQALYPNQLLHPGKVL